MTGNKIKEMAKGKNKKIKKDKNGKERTKSKVLDRNSSCKSE